KDWRQTLDVAALSSDVLLRVKALVQLCLANATISGTEVVVPEEVQQVSPDDRADAHGYLVHACLAAGQPALAMDLATKSAEHHAAGNDRRAAVWAITNLAEVHDRQLLFDETARLLADARAVWGEIGDRWSEADNLVRSANSNRNRSMIASALSCV